MNLTRAARSPLADPRRGFVSVLTAVFLVLVVLGVQAMCGVHSHEADHSGTSPHAAVEQHAAPGAAASAQAAASAPAAQIAPEYPGEDPNDCVEDRTVTARYDRTLSPSTDLAGVQSLALQWLVPDIAHHSARAPSGLAVAAAPSLHALGISRT